MQHSVFSASSAERWGNCPGSIPYSAGIPRSSSGAADEGTAGHMLADDCLKQGTEPQDYVGEFYDVDGTAIEITDDLADAVQLYVDYVRGISGVRLTEVRVYYAQLLGVDTEEGFGTTDTLIVAGRVLHVIDAKFGRRYVDPIKNKQMILYAAGALDALEAVGEADQIEEIQLHVVQPRVSTKPIPYVMPVAELREHVKDLRERAQRVVAAQFTFQPGDTKWQNEYLIPGEYQCQWCPAAATCPALRSRATSTTPIDEFELVNTLEALPASTVAENMALVPLLQIWIKAVEHEGFRRLTRGDQVPGFKLVLGREGNRKWSNVDDARNVLENDLIAAGSTPEDISEILFTEPKLLTAPQLEKALKKGKFKDASGTPLHEKIADLVVRAPARPTVTTDDDPREKWTEAAGADEFGMVGE